MPLQEDGSGCEIESLCTAAAPAAKRSEAQGIEALPLTSMESCESSALNFARAQLDGVGASNWQAPASVTADRQAAERTAHWLQVSRSCLNLLTRT